MPSTRMNTRSGTGGTTPNNPVLKHSVAFKYSGKTSMIVIGGITGKRYRFDRPGTILTVDPRDRPSLSAVPNLRQL